MILNGHGRLRTFVRWRTPPQHRAVKRRIADSDAEKLLRTRFLHELGDPVAELGDHIHEAVCFKGVVA